MTIWIAASLAAAAFVISLNSLQWLAEYQQYEDGDRSR